MLKPVPAEGANWRHALASPTAPQIPWKSEPNFLKIPAGMYFGETMGIARNSRGQIYVFTRLGDGSQLFQFDQNGNYMREIGRNSYAFTMAHGVYVDAQDYVWTVDEGTNTVIKWNPNTARPEMILGRRHESLEGLGPAIAPMPPPHPYAFNRPNDVVTDAQGNIFVADGYNNNRAIKYDKNGRFVASTIGTRGREPGQMHLPHSITADNAGNIYVGDRNNGRIQVFSNDLTLRAMYEHVGSPWSVCITPGPHQYLYSSNSNPDQNLAVRQRGDRRDFQDGAGRHGRRQVRKVWKGARRVVDRARHGLQERKRDSGRRDRVVARAEADARCGGSGANVKHQVSDPEGAMRRSLQLVLLAAAVLAIGSSLAAQLRIR